MLVGLQRRAKRRRSRGWRPFVGPASYVAGRDSLSISGSIPMLLPSVGHSRRLGHVRLYRVTRVRRTTLRECLDAAAASGAGAERAGRRSSVRCCDPGRADESRVARRPMARFVN
jgi:hypothetical protein